MIAFVDRGQRKSRGPDQDLTEFGLGLLLAPSRTGNDPSPRALFSIHVCLQ